MAVKPVLRLDEFLRMKETKPYREYVCGEVIQKPWSNRDHVRLVWVIDPSNATVTVLTAGEEARILGPDETLDGGDVLPGFSVPVSDIFDQMQV
jgi:Uma2 family endonuclease